MSAFRVPAVLAASLAAAGMLVAAEPPVIRIEASHQGFRPDTINLRKDEAVRIVLTSADGPHCFAVDALRVEKKIEPGRETILDLSPEESGSFSFYCCLEEGKAAEREWGQMIVSE